MLSQQCSLAVLPAALSVTLYPFRSLIVTTRIFDVGASHLNVHFARHLLSAPSISLSHDAPESRTATHIGGRLT